MFAAILDTSVLWPSLQRDFLLSLAVEGIYRPLWSEAILEELRIHEKLKLIKRGTNVQDAATSADHLVTEMKAHFSDAVVVGWEPLEGTYGLRDPNDEHVVAAAVVGGAGVIVTANVRDFDAVPAGIQVQPPHEFARDQATVDPIRAARAITEISKRHIKSQQPPAEILNLLASRYEMHALVPLVEPHLTI